MDFLLERPVLFEDIKIINKDLYKTLNNFTNLIKEKKLLIEKEPNIKEEEFENKTLYNNIKLNNLDISLFQESDYNLEEYVSLIYDYLF